jgi:hypothetical protein
MSEKSNAINRLCDVIENSYLRPASAPDETTVKNWHEDRYKYLMESYQVAPMSSSDEQLIDPAIAEWSQRESGFLRLFNGYPHNFEMWFYGMRESIINSDRIPFREWAMERNHFPHEVMEEARYKVTNLSVCTHFGFFYQWPSQAGKENWPE